MFRLMTVVAWPGPPSVRDWMTVKFCRLVMMELMVKKKVVGATAGMTTFLICCHLLAPSISAASTWDLSTFCSAPR